MKTILITQRDDYVSSYEEHRDALDQRWVPLLLEAGLFPVLVANNVSFVAQMMQKGRFDGLLLTGGNSLLACGGSSEVRDLVERQLLVWAIEHQLPVLGVCRGMQLIQQHFGTSLKAVPDHVGVKKRLHDLKDDRLVRLYDELGPVSVFHRFAAHGSEPPLVTIAKTTGDVVMAIRHETLPIYGIMWHPERETDGRDGHINFLKSVLGGAE